MNKIYLNTDGGSRGNPGPAAIGVAFYDGKNEELYLYSEFIGVATNNEAEYRAIIKGLEILSKSKWAKENEGNGLAVCRLDSELVVEQVCGRYKIKKDHIREFIETIGNVIQSMNISVEFKHVPREENKKADKLVNQALDKELKTKK